LKYNLSPLPYSAPFLLIAPEGIEISLPLLHSGLLVLLLIAPEGIEIDFSKKNGKAVIESLNRTRRN